MVRFSRRGNNARLETAGKGDEEVRMAKSGPKVGLGGNVVIA
jgi:hypothetical protein